MYQLTAWQVKELAKEWLRGKATVEDLDDEMYNAILDDQFSQSQHEIFDELVEELFGEFWEVEEGGF